MTDHKKGGDKASPNHRPTTLLLVRHGENDWVGKNRLAGWTAGVHLNKTGRKQAQATGRWLAKYGPRVDAIYASPLERTRETADLIARRLNLPVQPCEAIGEVEYGDWTGKRIKKLAKHPHWGVVQFYPSNAHFPAGESLYHMQTRAVHQVNELVARHKGQTILLVSHADVIKSVVAHYLGLHLDLFQRIVISPASITTIVFTFMRPLVQTVNSTGHLQVGTNTKKKKRKKKAKKG
ncbi:MAG: MSMEG_4193 family putative phosphomutase [Caldilineae bacterium]|nr:MAG: MSMEG_4193 family putative phosphomutase [Caldilineae bacterium]